MNKKLNNILNMFTEINNIPRKSRNERAISDWLVDWAIINGFKVERDEFLDVLISVPATPGYEARDTVVFQGHMDMVCEKTPESTHDFSKDPIEMYMEDGWLKAKGTSLGADNGIALAIAMVIATDKDVKHPPLELLFTVDEETGLTGAVNLPVNWLKGKTLINIDSEDEGVFTIGCAGGRDANIKLYRQLDTEFNGDSSLQITVGGLKGGHSGVDIHLEKANANIIIARLLKELGNRDIEFRIIKLEGGSAHNAIARDSNAVISIYKKDMLMIEEVLNSFINRVKDEYKKVDPGIFVKLEECNSSGPCCNTKVIDLILSLPHGVMYNSMEMSGVVETSSNLAVVSTIDGEFRVLTSQRSSVMSRLDEICSKVDSVVSIAGGSVEFGGGYPSWQPDFESKLLKDFVKQYKKIFKKDPVIEVIHAGLECGVIGSKYPGMEMISIGPTIKYPHCPDERMLISTVYDIWQLLVEFLK